MLRTKKKKNSHYPTKKLYVCPSSLWCVHDRSRGERTVLSFAQSADLNREFKKKQLKCQSVTHKAVVLLQHKSHMDIFWGAFVFFLTFESLSAHED